MHQKFERNLFRLSSFVTRRQIKTREARPEALRRATGPHRLETRSADFTGRSDPSTGGKSNDTRKSIRAPSAAAPLGLRLQVPDKTPKPRRKTHTVSCTAQKPTEMSVTAPRRHPEASLGLEWYAIATLLALGAVTDSELGRIEDLGWRYEWPMYVLGDERRWRVKP